MNYQETAIKSAEIYYQFLTDHGLGADEYRVLAIEVKGVYCILSLSCKLKSPDTVEIKIDNKKYTQEQIKPVEYNKLRRTLKVRPSLPEYFNDLAQAKHHHVLIISDLRFLVKRVENWYRTYGEKLELPVEYPQMDDWDFDIPGQTPSDDQRNAIRGALSTPISYIWGAPGTGKTRFVLARCILAYIRSGKRVLITAPTNNAVEQTLYGVLSVFEDAGIPMDNILRLGVPSLEFASKYPALCEDTDVARKLAEIDEEIADVDKAISENDKLLRLLPDFQRFIAYEKEFSRCEQELPPLLRELGELYEAKRKIICNIELRKGDEYIADHNLKKSEREKYQIAKQIEKLNVLIEENQSGIWRRLRRKHFDQLIAQLEIAEKSAGQADAECEKDRIIITQITFQRSDLTKQLDNIEGKIRRCKEQISDIDGFWMNLHDQISLLSESNYERQYQIIGGTLIRGRNHLNEKSLVYESLRRVTEAELFYREDLFKKKKEDYFLTRKKIETNSTSVKMGDCLVLAGTIDTCLFRVTSSDDFKPDHVFLDEAAYCSLIKGTTLLAYRCPVTFLGDHMQLPPVCEMNDDFFKSERYRPVCLWAQSVLHIEDIFTKSIDELSADYEKHKTACFQRIEKFNLIHSYRFGESIGRVLATCVYSKDFHGDINHNTDIFYINVQREQDHKKRTNVSECNAIKKYLNMTEEDNMGILTPYRNQTEKLLRIFGSNSDLDILTVHGSQGREWDTVLFSVVDRDDKWLTDSCSFISNGKCIINTAVSRARKRLIIVCDVDYWLKQRKQLIGQLLSVAKEVK